MDIFSKDIYKYLDTRLKEAKLDYASLFDDLKKKYRGMDIANVCNFILENKTDLKLLSYTLRVISNNKYRENYKPLLNFLLRSTDIELKVQAIKAISKYRNKSAVPVLLECLNDKNSNYKVRFVAADTLGKIGDTNAFDALKIVACDEEEKSAYVKESAVVALGNLGDKRAIDVFSSIMSSKQIFLDKFSYLKERIVEAMAKLDISKNEKAINILKRSLLDSSYHIRISSIEALMNSNSPESYDLIYERFKYDDNMEVRKNALVALYNISDRKILDDVICGNFELELKEYAQNIINEFEDKNE